MKRLPSGEKGLQKHTSPEVIDAKVQPEKDQKGGVLMPMLRKVADAARTVFGGTDYGHMQNDSGHTQNDPRLQTYSGIPDTFEPSIQRIIHARTNRDGTIDPSETRSLAQDIALLLVRMAKQFTAAQRQQGRQPEESIQRARAELMLALKTIALERAKAVLDDTARREFSHQLDFAILTKGAMERDY